jgi:hypothetical protein
MNIIPSPSNIGSMKTNPYRKCNKLDGLQVEPSSFNRIQAISALEVRVTAFSTSKIHVIKKIKKNTPLRRMKVRLQQPKITQHCTKSRIELPSF